MNQKLKSMDIIKGIGIIMIIIVHNRHFIMLDMSGLRPLINFGQMGCQLFFFVSGFTLCFSWEHMTNSKPGRLRIPKAIRFILRRYLRLAPGFLIFMMINLGLNILLINVFSFPPGFIMNREPLAILTNVFFVHGLFPEYINNVFPGGWYIGTAFLLYITFPLLYGIFKALRRIHPLCMAAVPVILLILNCFLLRWISDMPENELYLDNNTFLYFLFTNHIACFCLGILLFFQEKQDSTGTRRFRRKSFCEKCPLLISSLLFVLSAGVCIYLFMNPEAAYTYSVIPSLAGLSAYWLAVALIHIEKKNGKKLLGNFLAECGRNSYGMYLAHPLVCWYGMKALTYFLTENDGTYNDILLYCLMLVPSVFVVYVMGRYIEAALTWIDRRLRRA